MFNKSVMFFCAAAIATPVLAASPIGTPRSVIVSYAGLDLSTDAGRKVFDRKIHSAVRSVCGVAPGDGWVALAKARRCMKATKSDAQASASLAALRQQRDRDGTQVAIATK